MAAGVCGCGTVPFQTVPHEISPTWLNPWRLNQYVGSESPPVFLILLLLPAAKETAWQRMGAVRRYLTVAENELAVYQNVVDARTGLVR